MCTTYLSHYYLSKNSDFDLKGLLAFNLIGKIVKNL
jgi:hypothetical protein